MRASALVVALVLAVTMVVAPASTYTSASADRGSAVDVASDPNAVIAVETPDASGVSASGDFVTVTNRLDVPQTVTVRLENKTTEYDLATAQNDLSGSPDSVRVELDPGEPVSVDYVGNGQSKGDARFTVETTGSVSATIPDRVRRIDEPGGGPPGNGGGPPGNSDDPACNNPGNGPSRCQ